MTNFYTDLRSFIKKRVCEVDKTLTYDKTITDNTKFGALKLDKKYKITFGDLANTDTGVSDQGDLTLTVTIYKQLDTKDSESGEDYLLCKALEIGLNCSDKTKVSQSGIVKKISFAGSVKELTENNDNALQVTISFVVSAFYKNTI